MAALIPNAGRVMESFGELFFPVGELAVRGMDAKSSYRSALWTIDVTVRLFADVAGRFVILRICCEKGSMARDSSVRRAAIEPRRLRKSTFPLGFGVKREGIEVD